MDSFQDEIQILDCEYQEYMIKAVKRACVVCRKLYASPMHQKMSDLPPERCELLKQPFSDTGFDVFGPYYVEHGRSEAKRYSIVFTCFTTCAIHIEKLNSLETNAIINALFCFVSRRWCPKTVRWDNATNYVGGHNELSKSLRQSVADYFGLMLGRRRSCWADVGPLAAMFSWLLGNLMTDHYDGLAYCFLWVCALCTHILYFVSFVRIQKDIQRISLFHDLTLNNG